MKKITILKIKQKGMVVEIGGKQIRTPAKIDITGKDINKIMMSLKTNGIDNFTISSDIENNLAPKVEQVSKDKIHNTEVNSIYERFDKIDGLLSKLIEQPRIVTDKKTRKKRTPKVEELEDPMFIPEINLDGLKTGGKKLKTIDGPTGDISESVELLTKTKKRSKK